IVDADGRIVAVLLGRPEGDEWDNILCELRDLMDSVRRCGLRRGVFHSGNKHHRRGDFHVLQAGVTKGPGQKKPGNLAHSKPYRRLLRPLMRHCATCRIAGFQSSSHVRYLPKMYHHQHATMQGIFADQLDLIQPFRNSVFPTVTFNLGPDVVTPKHLDMLNNPAGFCAVTAVGDFDHTQGGHFYMKQLKTVCEFPLGSTILLLSGTCEHGNTPIQKNETQYSMSQYAAGVLFRWAAYGYQSSHSLLAQVDGARCKGEITCSVGARVAFKST
ncbi:hypothetical protein K438DRAFT_1619494, partial [Mycena galopus ATCC 62051]